MHLSTRKSRIEYWINHYRGLDSKGYANEMGKEIAKLDPLTTTENDLVRLGLNNAVNSTWECSECHTKVEDYVLLGESWDTIVVCKDCLKKALELF